MGAPVYTPMQASKMYAALRDLDLDGLVAPTVDIVTVSNLDAAEMDEATGRQDGVVTAVMIEGITYQFRKELRDYGYKYIRELHGSDKDRWCCVVDDEAQAMSKTAEVAKFYGRLGFEVKIQQADANNWDVAADEDDEE